MKEVTVRTQDVQVGDTLKGYGKVDFVEIEGRFVCIGYDGNGGNWGDFFLDDELIRIEE